jgi:hypothetical protein
MSIKGQFWTNGDQNSICHYTLYGQISAHICRILGGQIWATVGRPRRKGYSLGLKAEAEKMPSSSSRASRVSSSDQIRPNIRKLPPQSIRFSSVMAEQDAQINSSADGHPYASKFICFGPCLPQRSLGLCVLTQTGRY